ncbi:phosphotransferase [Pseudonocardia hierapolitana]|uniref:phosphotransferase n=1 Tax=Pseudonocardia hierapolitana TaxID=1128676 RepID=UPI001FE3891F|nr:phosphotransferase [Pseudonocardia hierapolitana]
MTTAPLPLLLGPDARELLAVALEGHRSRLRTLRAVTVGVQPGGATVVQYAADVERADGSVTRETLTATTGDRIPEGAAVLAGHGVQVGVWRWPQDPALPALATATDPVRLSAALRDAGSARDSVPRIRTRAYRPGRRAVLEVEGGGPRLYVKVVRPRAVAALKARHDLLASHVPVPRVLAATADGMLVLDECPGMSLRSHLSRDLPVPSPADLDDLLGTLPPALLDRPRRSTHLERVPHFTAVLAATAVTGEAELARLDALATRLAQADPGTHPDVAVHGDFYDGQLLCDEQRITGLVDVDTAGPGHRIDEWATLLAHLSVLALHGTAAARHYGARVLAHAEERFSRSELRPRVAAAVLGLATGPFRVQQAGWTRHTRARLGLAEQWATG